MHAHLFQVLPIASLYQHKKLAKKKICMLMVVIKQRHLLGSCIFKKGFRRPISFPTSYVKELFTLNLMVGSVGTNTFVEFMYSLNFVDYIFKLW